MEQLHLGIYSREDLSTIIGVDNSNKNFARRVKDTLGDREPMVSFSQSARFTVWYKVRTAQTRLPYLYSKQ